MTEEQRKARKNSAENGNIRWIKDNCLRTKDGEDDYVFISYKSDDFENVLDNIVYNTCKKYGLRVYFDTAFDENSDSWITQYYDNMCNVHCKAFIAFIDDSYYSSYACLLEMMTRKTCAAGGDFREDTLFFLPINVGRITDIVDSSNTGLGTERYSDGKINKHAKEELMRFNEVFSDIADDEMRKIYKRDKDIELYGEKTSTSMQYGKPYLIVTQCRRLMEKVIPSCNDNDGGNKDWEDVIHDKLVNAGITTVFGNTGSGGGVTFSSAYTYTIFGKAYKANDREQGKLMFDAFEALVEHYPGCEEKLTQRTSVAKAENVKMANTKNADPVYFRGCREFVINGQKYLVGTSYSFKAKIAEIKGMFKICGADLSEFVLNGEPLGSVGQIPSDLPPVTDNCFKFRLWDREYKASSLADMMHAVFDLVAEKYSLAIPQMADNESITSVARKDDVDNAKLPPNKLNYFTSKKEHVVDGSTYYVSTRYNREQGIGQIEKILVFCEGNSKAFEITVQPDKTKKITNGKKGIGELI